MMRYLLDAILVAAVIFIAANYEDPARAFSDAVESIGRMA